MHNANSQFAILFTRSTTLQPLQLGRRAVVHGWDGGVSIGFLTNYNTRTTPLDYKLLIMPWRCHRGDAGWAEFVPIFGWPGCNFRCIIYSRFNEPRKRSKGPRGLFLIIRWTREGRATDQPLPRNFHSFNSFYSLFFLLVVLLPFLRTLRSMIVYYSMLLLLSYFNNFSNFFHRNQSVHKIYDHLTGSFLPLIDWISMIFACSAMFARSRCFI